MIDLLDLERFKCSFCGRENMKAVEGTWPKRDSSGEPKVEFAMEEDDSGWMDYHETFVCYDCLE